MISHKHNFIFIHPPKTGGTSVEMALAPYSDDELKNLSYYYRGNENPAVIHQQMDIKHAKLGSLQAIVGRPLDEFTIFCTTRNPWERVISSFAWHMNKPDPGIRNRLYNFIPLIVNTAVMPTSPVLEYVNVTRLLPEIRFIDTEDLNDVFPELCESLGLPRLELPHANKNDRPHYSEYYNPYSIRLIEQRFKADIDYFGYTFDDKCGARERPFELPERHR